MEGEGDLSTLTGRQLKEEQLYHSSWGYLYLGIEGAPPTHNPSIGRINMIVSVQFGIVHGGDIGATERSFRSSIVEGLYTKLLPTVENAAYYGA